MAAAAQDDTQVDFAAVSKKRQKRLSPEEQAAINKIIWDTTLHDLDKIIMRASIEFALPSHDARRGMDLRQVMLTGAVLGPAAGCMVSAVVCLTNFLCTAHLQIKLGMLFKDILQSVKPAVCHVIGVNLFKAKGGRALDNSGVSVTYLGPRGRRFNKRISADTPSPLHTCHYRRTLWATCVQQTGTTAQSVHWPGEHSKQ